VDEPAQQPDPAQQQQALENEPGFRELPAQTQQNMRNRLAQLNAMPPQQRDRVLNRNIEAMEHLHAGAARAGARSDGAARRTAARPAPFVARSFRELRELPPEQRMAAMNSPRYAGQMNDAQRATLSNLLRVEPMLPPPEKQ
jgi:phage-related protein